MKAFQQCCDSCGCEAQASHDGSGGCDCAGCGGGGEEGFKLKLIKLIPESFLIMMYLVEK
jgi:hypothetical protein